ncbi:MAG: SDR family NAD(P)-dependent oxidoreductase [Gemmatimonadetes bacterium]|nr:SDR family NAD(P)-dependent oxidoreductase [Gemmatimonadota bacterium]NNM03958.1 SDR family NAD(P)-dependent oxidoreductase [Gemmatimonadota bacterium]
MGSTSPICLITGAARGLGRELAEVASSSGAAVIAMGRPHPGVRSLLFEGEADIRSSEAVADFMEELPVDRIDILINNAGVFPDPDVGLADLSLEAVVDTLDVNAVGALRVTRACLPYLLRSPYPRILNISSGMGSMSYAPRQGSYGYRMSKAALNMLTSALATEFPQFKVLSIHPGHVRTEMGGPRATVDSSASAAGIWELARTPPAEGRFFDYQGQALAW